MLNKKKLLNNILKGGLLEGGERKDCEVFLLTQIFEDKYEIYHGRAEEM